MKTDVRGKMELFLVVYLWRMGIRHSGWRLMVIRLEKVSLVSISRDCVNVGLRHLFWSMGFHLLE